MEYGYMEVRDSMTSHREAENLTAHYRNRFLEIINTNLNGDLRRVFFVEISVGGQARIQNRLQKDVDAKASAYHKQRAYLLDSADTTNYARNYLH